MIIFNGFEDGESRSSKHRPRKADEGHSVVETSTTRRGSAFSFTYAVTCQCGKKYTSRTGIARAWSSHDAHKAKEASRVGA